MTTAPCGACGPLAERFEQARAIIDMVAQGHIYLAEHWESVAKDMTSDQDAEALIQLGKFHRECAEATRSNVPQFEEDKANDQPTVPDVGRDGVSERQEQRRDGEGGHGPTPTPSR